MPESERKIYLKQEEIRIGFGSTGKTTRLQNYYQAVEIDAQSVQLRLLDIQDQPMGKPEVIDKETLSKEYIYCPDYLKNKKNPKDLKAQEHVRQGDEHLQKKELLSAEFEYKQALAIDDNHLKANLGMGRTLSAQGEEEKAKGYFTKLCSIDDLYEKENKHIFNELGIELRKKGMFGEAIFNYQKAITIDPDDPVLHYNLARAYYENGETDLSRKQMEKALQAKSDFEEAREFIESIGAPASPPPGV
jgi:tetratricopeptide (TPR) repeat protein